MFPFNSSMKPTIAPCENPNPNHEFTHRTTIDPHLINQLPNFESPEYLAFDGLIGEESSGRSVDKLSNDVERRKGKKYKTTKDELRFTFRTKSTLEIMDDGYKWRKYGKKMVKSSPHPRNYFKCTSEGCSVKKRVERDAEDPNYVLTTYYGMHNHHTPNCTVTYNNNKIPWTLQPSSSLQC